MPHASCLMPLNGSGVIRTGIIPIRYAIDVRCSMFDILPPHPLSIGIRCSMFDVRCSIIELLILVRTVTKVLTLASKERIPLLAHMRMIFEIRDLKYATPASVSRAGILYISTEGGQQWHSLIASWVMASSFHEDVKAQLSGLFEMYVPKAIQVLSTQMKTSVETEPTTVVSALLKVCPCCSYGAIVQTSATSKIVVARKIL